MELEFIKQEGDHEKLPVLLNQINGWVMRHIACAIVAVLLVTVLVNFPTQMNQPGQLATITGIYAIISSILAFVESLLALKISHLTAIPVATEKTKITAHTPWQF